MAVETFAKATTACPVVFCDSNFLVELCIVASPPLVSAFRSKPAALARAQVAVAFYERYRRDYGTQFISSPLALEEIAHKLTQAALFGTGYGSWKELKRGDRSEFEKRREALRVLVDELERALSTYDVLFVVPRSGSDSSSLWSKTTLECKLALHFFQAYDALDAADAFHVSLALSSGAQWMASSDEAMQSVAEINHFTGLKA